MNKKLIILALVAVLSVVSLTACSGTPKPKEPPIALSIVFVRSGGVNDPTEDMYSEIAPLIERAVYDGYISIVIADGDPHVIKTFGRDAFPSNARSVQYMNNLIDKRTREVLEHLKDHSAVRGITPEIAMLEALTQAERSFNAADAKGLERHIIVLGGTGITTAGYLNLQEVQLSADSAENGYIDNIVTELSSSRGRIPDLSDVTFHWVGLGNVAHPQRLPSTIGVQLEDLWRAVLRESGATFDDRDIRISATGGTPIIGTEDKDGFPLVTTIYFGDDGIVLPPPPVVVIGNNGDETGEPVEPPEPPPSLEILSDQVPFVPDQATFLNETAARMVLQKYVDWLTMYFKVYPDSTVYVVGFHARVSLDGGNRLNTGLSERRADTVRTTLIELGVPEDRLITVGLGINGGDHFRVDEFSDGTFNTTIAQQNRKVMLIPDLSDDAPILLEVMAELDALRN